MQWPVAGRLPTHDTCTCHSSSALPSTPLAIYGIPGTADLSSYSRGNSRRAQRPPLANVNFIVEASDVFSSTPFFSCIFRSITTTGLGLDGPPGFYPCTSRLQLRASLAPLRSSAQSFPTVRTLTRGDPRHNGSSLSAQHCPPLAANSHTSSCLSPVPSEAGAHR